MAPFVPLPWEKRLWTRRRWPGRARFTLTDFRLVVEDRRGVREMPLDDIGEIQRIRTAADRVLGTSTLLVFSRRPDPEPLRLPGVRAGTQLAALIDLLSSDPKADLDAAGVRAALAWKPRAGRKSMRAAVASLAAILAAVFAVAIGLQGDSTPVVYPADDAIWPGGEKRDRVAIVRFMETTVLPWARETLAPIVGSPDAVTCGTCHGDDAEPRGWRMPAVAALPEPLVRMRGLELHAGQVDAQVRNAIYGYVADSEKLAKAAYMREFVMPGMATLLRRPAYDFTRSYEYNRRRFAFGCYHCHKVS